MNNFVVRVKITQLEKEELFLTKNCNLKLGDYVLIKDKKQKKKIGIVVSNPAVTKNPEKFKNLILNKIEEKDLKEYKSNLEKTEKIFNIIKNEANRLKLGVKFLFADFCQDDGNVIITYCTDKKINCQNFFPTKYSDLNIKFYQINNRKRSSVIGGLGVCGRKLCCTTFFKKTKNISIEKIKNQNLMLNINKLTGVCCKLKCCLCFENEIYVQENKKFPKIGSIVKIDNKNYKILSFNIINQIVKCDSKNGIVYFPLKKINESKK